jgi:hypothetical protein
MSTHRCSTLNFEQLPQSRRASVVSLTQLEEDRSITVVPLRAGASPVLPDESGKYCRHLVSLRWAQSPTDSRHERYYLSRQDGEWCLWNCHRQSLESLDFEAEHGYLKLTPTWCLLAHSAGPELSARAAGYRLLYAYLAHQRNEAGLGRFYSVSRPGRLTEEDLRVIARAVWSEQADSSSRSVLKRLG